MSLSSQDVSSGPFSSYAPRVAIVTGAASGIGYAIAHRLADDGIDVAINDTVDKQKQIDEVVEELRKKGRRALAIPGDVSSETDVVSFVQKTVHDLGSVDIMVANAGIGLISSFLETSVDAFDKSYAVNVRGVFLCFKHAALQMIKQGRGGRLIAASSSAGKQGGPNLTAYSASKFAIRGLTQSACIELRKYGITANSYAPGFIRTPLTTADGKDDNCVTVKELLGAPSDTPVSGPDTVASIVSYLVKPEAYFVNGTNLLNPHVSRLSRYIVFKDNAYQLMEASVTIDSTGLHEGEWIQGCFVVSIPSNYETQTDWAGLPKLPAARSLLLSS